MSSRLGYLYNCEIIKLTPQDFKNKAVRALAGKLVLFILFFIFFQKKQLDFNYFF